MGLALSLDQRSSVGMTGAAVSRKRPHHIKKWSASGSWKRALFGEPILLISTAFQNSAVMHSCLVHFLHCTTNSQRFKREKTQLLSHYSLACILESLFRRILYMH